MKYFITKNPNNETKNNVLTNHSCPTRIWRIGQIAG